MYRREILLSLDNQFHDYVYMCWNDQRKKEEAITNLFIEPMTLARCSCPHSNKGRVAEQGTEECEFSFICE